MKKSIIFLFFVPFLLAILQSSLTFGSPKGVPGEDIVTASVEEPATQAAPLDTLSDWQVLELAIAYTESRFDPEAQGKAGDLGIYQIVPIYVTEINRLSGYEAFRHEDAADIGKSIEMFNAMQGFKNPGHDLDLAIYYHNKSSAYHSTVMRNCEMIRRYETLRAQLKDYHDEGNPH